MTQRRTLRERLSDRLDVDGSAPTAPTASTEATDPSPEAADAPHAATTTSTDVPPPPPPATAPDTTGAPPRRRIVGPLEAVLRHKLLAIVPLFALVGTALAIVFARSPDYTAEARLTVGRVDVPAYTLQGVILGNATLAVSYARAINAPDVVNTAARRTGLSPSAVRDRLNASPVPESTLIRVEATGPSQASAVRLANAGADAMAAYVTRLNQDTESSQILRRYQAAARTADAAGRRAQRIAGSSGTGSKAAHDAFLAAQSAQLRATSLDQLYRANVINQPAPNLVRVLSQASTATSDRTALIQELLLIAVVAGIVLGIALALLRANRDFFRPRG